MHPSDSIGGRSDAGRKAQDAGAAPRIALIMGGARSGKSTHAEALALRRFRRPLYLATAEVTDAEMAARIARHRERRGAAWRSLEEPLDLAGALARAAATDADGVVVECLTTWLGNVLVREGAAAWPPRRDALLEALRRRRLPAIVVSNEVGLGIVPPSELGRIFRDEAGWLNQAVAALADDVTLVVAGLPLAVKGAV